MCVGRFFAVIVNIYIPGLEVRASVNIRDKTLEALNDSHYVAPLVETGDYYSSHNARSWFYLFDYQTKNSYVLQIGIFLFILQLPCLRPKPGFGIIGF